jgi:hypothetical protein
MRNLFNEVRAVSVAEKKEENAKNNIIKEMWRRKNI